MFICYAVLGCRVALAETRHIILHSHVVIQILSFMSNNFILIKCILIRHHEATLINRNPQIKHNSACKSSLVKHLLHRLPPAWRAGLRTHGARYQAVLVSVGHLPPFAHLGVLGHELHVAGVIIADILEGGEEQARCVVIVDAVCERVSREQNTTTKLCILANSQARKTRVQ